MNLQKLATAIILCGLAGMGGAQITPQTPTSPATPGTLPGTSPGSPTTPGSTDDSWHVAGQLSYNADSWQPSWNAGCSSQHSR